jgi:hypothetical protein
LIGEFIRSPQTLEALKYFTTRVTHQAEKYERQDRYLRALDASGGLEIVHGVFEMRSVQCRECAAWYKRPQEKRTDVNIATHLVDDAFDGRLDIALMVCGRR